MTKKNKLTALEYNILMFGFVTGIIFGAIVMYLAYPDLFKVIFAIIAAFLISQFGRRFFKK